MSGGCRIRCRRHVDGGWQYVSVSSQSDTEEADLARERRQLAEQPEAELAELAKIYEQRGVESTLALEVARRMMAKDPFTAHARDGWAFQPMGLRGQSRRPSRRP